MLVVRGGRVGANGVQSGGGEACGGDAGRSGPSGPRTLHAFPCFLVAHGSSWWLATIAMELKMVSSTGNDHMWWHDHASHAAMVCWAIIFSCGSVIRLKRIYNF
jgi:hypothetical protein